MRFKSAISWGLVAFLGVILGTTSALMMRDGAWGGLVINAAVVAFIVHGYFTTYYVLEDDALRVRCSFFCNLRIPYASIRRVKYTSNPLSSPAFSLKRLQIDYDKMSSVMISPDTRESFVEALKAKTGSEVEYIVK